MLLRSFCVCRCAPFSHKTLSAACAGEQSVMYYKTLIISFLHLPILASQEAIKLAPISVEINKTVTISANTKGQNKLFKAIAASDAIKAIEVIRNLTLQYYMQHKIWPESRSQILKFARRFTDDFEWPATIDTISFKENGKRLNLHFTGTNPKECTLSLRPPKQHITKASK
jgi:hypothetical protein